DMAFLLIVASPYTCCDKQTDTIDGSQTGAGEPCGLRRRRTPVYPRRAEPGPRPDVVRLKRIAGERRSTISSDAVCFARLSRACCGEHQACLRQRLLRDSAVRTRPGGSLGRRSAPALAVPPGGTHRAPAALCEIGPLVLSQVRRSGYDADH